MINKKELAIIAKVLRYDNNKIIWLFKLLIDNEKKAAAFLKYHVPLWNTELLYTKENVQYLCKKQNIPIVNCDKTKSNNISQYNVFNICNKLQFIVFCYFKKYFFALDAKVSLLINNTADNLGYNYFKIDYLEK